MKCLGGGNLINIKQQAFEFVLKFPYLHSVAVGMKSIEEVIANTMIFQKPIPSFISEKL